MPTDANRKSAVADSLSTGNVGTDALFDPARARVRKIFDPSVAGTGEGEWPSANEIVDQDTDEIVDLATSVYDDLSDNQIDQVEDAIFGDDAWRSGSASGDE